MAGEDETVGVESPEITAFENNHALSVTEQPDPRCKLPTDGGFGRDVDDEDSVTGGVGGMEYTNDRIIAVYGRGRGGVPSVQVKFLKKLINILYHMCSKIIMT